MRNRSIRLAQRVVVISICVLLSQGVNYGQSVNPIVKLRLSFDTRNTRQVEFSPVSKLLAIQREDGSVQIFDIASGREQAVLPLADKGWYSMKWTKDGLRLLIINSKSAAMWDARAGARLSAPVEIKRDKYFILFEEVTLSPDEKFLLNVKQDRSFKAMTFDRQKSIAQVWSLETGQLKFEIKVMGVSARAVLSPDGKQILTTSDKEEPRLWDVETGRLFTPLSPPERAIFQQGSSATFSPNGRVIIQTHEAGTYIWDSFTGALRTRIPFAKDSSGGKVDGFTRDGKMFARVHQTGGWHSLTVVEFRDSETGELKSTLTAPKFDDWPDQELWSDDGRTFVAASGSNKYEARIWDVSTGRLKGKFPMLRTYSRWPMDFGFKDRDHINIHPTLPVISAANEKFVRLWSADTGELLQQLDNTGGFGEWSADGQLFLTFTKDLKSAQVWDVVGLAESRPRWATRK
jgi:WD40 repeat protein